MSLLLLDYSVARPTRNAGHFKNCSETNMHASIPISHIKVLSNPEQTSPSAVSFFFFFFFLKIFRNETNQKTGISRLIPKM